MKGSIGFRKTGDGGYHFVSWYIGKKQYKINKYKGMICRHKSMAERLLSVMRADDESGFFRIEKYIKNESNVIQFLKDWIDTEVDPKENEIIDSEETEKKGYLSPATIKDYKNSVFNHLIPWFKKHSVMLHEIQYDVLCALLNDIKRAGKGKQNVMYCLHTALLYAARSGKIQLMPLFPEKKKYKIEPVIIKAVSETRQMAIIEAIPIEHQPIFWWLKYHFRRPAEALALHKEDYDKERDCFIVRRSFSSKELVQHTKTHDIHTIPVHPEFRPWMDCLHASFGPYYFTHESSRMDGKRYQHDYLVDLWNEAKKKCGETINLYAGLKHSSCTAFVNEHGGSVDELQMLTDHKRRDSVLKYTDIKLEAKRRIQAKVIDIRTQQEHKNKQQK